jgi:hypothetical protein
MYFNADIDNKDWRGNFEMNFSGRVISDKYSEALTNPSSPGLL